MSFSRCRPRSISRTGRICVAQQIRGGVRDEHLAAVCRGADSRSSVDADPDVPLGCGNRLGGVDPHPDPDLPAIRPGVRAKPALGVDRRAHRIIGTVEGDEEGIALGVDLDPAGCGDALANQPSMLLQHLPIAFRPDLTEQPGRAFDVGEEEGDGPARSFRHTRGA